MYPDGTPKGIFMTFYMVNVAFLLVTLVAYFVTRLGSIKQDHIVSGILFLPFCV